MTEFLNVNPAQARALAMCLASSQAHDMLVQAAQLVETSELAGAYEYVPLHSMLRARVSYDFDANATPTPQKPLPPLRVPATATFKVGQRVRFGRPNGQQHLGVITKVNVASIKITEDVTGRKWKCAPSLAHVVA